MGCDGLWAQHGLMESQWIGRLTVPGPAAPVAAGGEGADLAWGSALRR
jgi:hypothetical protein